MDRLPSYLVAAVTVVMTVATVLLGITVPSLWSMAGDIGALKARADEASRRFDAIDKRFDAIDKRFEGIDGKLDLLIKRTDAIEMRLAARESDPTTLVAQAGFRPESEFAGVRVGEKLYVLPKTDKAQGELASAGLQRASITPSVFGYVLGTFDLSGRLQLSGSAQGAAAPR